MRSIAAIGAIVGLCCGLVVAQVNTLPRFDAASIRRSAANDDTFMTARPGGRLELSAVNLKAMIALAWRLQTFEISGGPAWLRSERFNVNTEAAQTPCEDQLLLMLQALLTERFSLKVHFKTEDRPVYLLTAGKTGGTPSPGLQISAQGSCVKPDPTAPPDPDACGSIGVGVNHLEAHEVSMARLAEALSLAVERKVIDRTGRTDKFNISLRWRPDEQQAYQLGLAIALPPDTPSIFTALGEQLGLKLEPGKAPVEVLVIDRAERPDDN